MASLTPSMRHFSTCLRCVRHVPAANGAQQRLLSSSPAVREDAQTQPAASSPAAPPPPPSAPDAAAPAREVPEYMQKWGKLDPETVENKKQERRLFRRDGVQPVGSRRRRAALRLSAIRKTEEVPFEQLPYQCFQEARAVLQEDRLEKLKEIKTQQQRMQAVAASKASEQSKRDSIARMQSHMNDLIIAADINDPIVKRKFEDGQGDMNKPIYRHLADRKWREVKRKVLEQRVTQLNIVPDLLGSLDLAADIDLSFGRKAVAPGDFVESYLSEKMPTLHVQTFTPGEKLVTVAVVDADVPVPEEDGFSTRCHFIASNIRISPSETSIPLQRIAEDDQKSTNDKKVALPWMAPWAHKGAPYHRLAIVVLEQNQAKKFDVSKLSTIERDGFNLRNFVGSQKLKPLTATLFRTKWDESMAGVLERAGLKDQASIEYKRKRVEPLPYKRRTERMR
ncbi:phosphatidylethanolamine-binding protein [Boeremia exigua]|uniref:phosphatidylethanolamine-binding protein n=1 Tax=Boeremia exigua TaxID=749465 RepID=UPI001E8DE751|nr:phosphatidylethanolamine-binding protein [Boeremia exigua]KAH6625234.1 phosphatidylethanolamine-binding protein [Boeremia exigua]